MSAPGADHDLDVEWPRRFLTYQRIQPSARLLLQMLPVCRHVEPRVRSGLLFGQPFERVQEDD